MYKKISAFFVATAMSLSLAACGGGGGSDCEAVADHVMKILEKDMGKMLEALPEEQRNKAKEEMAKEKDKNKKEFVERCKKEANEEMRKCAMAAKSLEDLGKCESKKKPAAEGDKPAAE